MCYEPSPTEIDNKILNMLQIINQQLFLKQGVTEAPIKVHYCHQEETIYGLQNEVA